MMPNQNGRELRQALKRLAPYFGVVLLFSFIVNLLMLTPALYMLQIYDRVLNSRNEVTLLLLTGLVVGLYLLLGVLEWFRSRVLARVGALFDAAIHDHLFQSALKAALHGAPGKGRQAFNDLAQLRQFLASQAPFALFDAPWSPVYVATIFLLHPDLGFFAIGAAILLIALAVANEALTRPLLDEASQKQLQAVNFASAILANAEVAEAMGMEGNLRRRWLERHLAALRLQLRASDRGSGFAATTRSLRITVQSLILGFGAYLVLTGDLTAGGMIAASILLSRSLAPVEQLVAQWRAFVQAREAFVRLEALLERVPPPAARLKLPAPRGEIVAENLFVLPPGAPKPVLRALNFQIPAGTTVGVVGPSASGKSTLLRALVGIWPPYAGTLRIDGAEITHWERDLLGRSIGYLPQDIELFEGTVAENIARFGEVSDERVIAAAKFAGVHEMILRLPQGYETQVGPGGARLSGGQRQRIALARALYGDPQIVVLDEPDASLDETGEMALVAAIQRLKAEGKTVIVVSHRRHLVSLCDRVMVLREGALAAYGPREEILSAAKRTSLRPV